MCDVLCVVVLRRDESDLERDGHVISSIVFLCLKVVECRVEISK